MNIVLPAITLTQPWAALFLTPRKQIETRGWRLDCRGPLAIHAAKNWKKEDAALATAAGLTQLDFGAVIGIVFLDSVLPITDEFRQKLEAHGRHEELRWGNYEAGRFAWVRDANVLKLETPVVCRGWQKIWNWPLPDDLKERYAKWLLEIAGTPKVQP